MTYVLPADDSPLTSAGVVSAPVLVNAPVASPLGLDAWRAGRVSGTVVVGEITADKVFVGLRRADLQDRDEEEHIEMKWPSLVFG